MMIFRRLFSTRETTVFDPPDVLDHPDLRRMTLRELADLPLPRPAFGQSDDAKTGAGPTPPLPMG